MTADTPAETLKREGGDVSFRLSKTRLSNLNFMAFNRVSC